MKIFFKQCLLLILLSLVAGCSSKTGSAKDALLVQEAVIRYQFAHNSASRRDVVSIFCVELLTETARGDPPVALIQSLNNGQRKVLAGSACAQDPERGVVETVSGKPALILVIGEVVWSSKASAKVEGGYYEGSLSASGNMYSVEKVDGVWRATKDEMSWIA